MVSSAKGRDKLASGIAYCIRRSKHLGCAETTQSLWKALHSLAADQHSFSKPALCLVQALDLQSGLQLPSSMDQAPAEVSPVTRVEIGTQTIEAVITESEWKLQTEQIVKMTVDMTVAQTTAPVKTLMDQLQELQRQNQLPTPADSALEAASSQVVVQPTAVERQETHCNDTMDPEPSSSRSLHARHSGPTLDASSFQLDQARQKEERRNARKAALLARAGWAHNDTSRS